MKESMLKKYYTEAVKKRYTSLYDIGYMYEKYKLTQHDLSCVVYMLKRGKYFHEIEEIFNQDRLPGNGRTGNIRFLETVSEQIRDSFYSSKLTKKQKEYYVSVGFAKWNIYEYERQFQIHLYVKISEVSNSHRKSFIEAINRKDRLVLYNYFSNYTKTSVKRYMRKMKHSQNDTDKVLDLLFMIEKNSALKQIIQKGNKVNKANKENKENKKNKAKIPEKVFSLDLKIWQVILFDCKCHFEYQIINTLMETLGCTLCEAIKFTEAVEKIGSVPIFTGDKQTSVALASKLEETLITVEVREI